MKMKELISLTAGCAALLVGFALMGCDSTHDIMPACTDTYIMPACTDTCTMIMIHSNIPEEEIEEQMAICLENCTNPGTEEDVAIRDCSLACDMSLSRDAYLACLCDCGITDLCP